MNPDSIPRQVVNAALRVNLPFFGIACVVLVVGLSSLLLARLRSRDRLLFWVGVFSVLYASRLFIQNELVHAAVNVRDQAFGLWALCLTYLIPIPLALFARELLGPGWKGTIKIWILVQIIFAAAAIPTALFAHRYGLADAVNSYLVIGGTLLMLLHVLLRGGASGSFAKSLTWPLFIFGFLVVLRNRGFMLAGVDIEPLGFVILLGGLGFTASRRALATERKLTEVEQELTTARRIQSSIIPHSSPDFLTLRFATRYEPMTSVAGDFYDFIEASPNCLTVLVADVSGHGVPAALVASMLKVCFAAQQHNAHNPAAVLAGLNLMLRGSLGGQYVTAACAAIDVGAQVITYAGAGHPPSLLFRRSTGDLVRLAENGLFIGPFPQATYSNIAVPFQSGDKLLLYTDGILEATGPDGQEFGLERLEHLLLNANDLEPAEFVEQLFRKISTPAQQDDLTVVLVHLDGAAPAA